MKRIESQGEGFRELAKKVLFWVIHTKRTLSTAELQYALAVQPGNRVINKDFIPGIEIIGPICAGLVVVDIQSNVVRLVHYTTQEYFQRIPWFLNAEADITRTCVTYLSFDAFKTGFCSTDKEFEERLRSNVLYDYAARNWGHHARNAAEETQQLVVDFLKSEVRVSSSGQAMMASRIDSGYSQRVPRQVTGEHLAAYFGLTGVIMALLKNKHDPDVKDSYGRTPLSWAAENGHEAVVRLLLDTGADLETKDKDHDRTPLLYAAAKGHEAVVKLLLEKGAELEVKDEAYNQTALLYAAEEGHEAVVKLLLEKGAELETESYNSRTPLSYAAQEGHEAVVKLLLEKGAKK
jgi:hypothetical protein